MNSQWSSIKNFRVDQGGERLTFIDRLARENGWSFKYAGRVYTEYLKFLYLAVVSKRQVTPSDEVDQAWHLHLCYSESYWVDLCEKTLKKKLHHGPTKGGKSENDKYWEQYEATRSLYAREFGAPPPGDIWPSPGKRFSRANRFVRINSRDSFVISKKATYLTLGVLVSAGLLSGCGLIGRTVKEGEPKNLIALLVITGICLWIIYKCTNNGDGGDGHSGCSSAGGGTGISGGFGGGFGDFGGGGGDGGDGGCGGGGCGDG